MNTWARAIDVGAGRSQDAQDDAAAKLEQIMTEADDLIRRRLEESGLEVMHVILAITKDGMGVVRTNVGPELLRPMGEELVDVSGQMEPPKLGDAQHRHFWEIDQARPRIEPLLRRTASALSLRENSAPC